MGLQVSEEESILDLNTLPAAEFAAQSILRRFPQATLKVLEGEKDKVYEIYFKEKILLKIDKRGARYFFPSRRKRNVSWSKRAPSTLPRTIDYILRDLAEADYQVLSTINKQIPKRPIHISRYTRCPICKERASLKVIFRGESLPEENSEIYTAISRTIELNGAEIKCILCGWVGIREEFSRKSRRFR